MNRSRDMLCWRIDLCTMPSRADRRVLRPTPVRNVLGYLKPMTLSAALAWLDENEARLRLTLNMNRLQYFERPVPLQCSLLARNFLH